MNKKVSVTFLYSPGEYRKVTDTFLLGTGYTLFDLDEGKLPQKPIRYLLVLKPLGNAEENLPKLLALVTDDIEVMRKIGVDFEAGQIA